MRTQHTSFESMVRLGDLVLAKAGQEQVSDPKEFDNRTGYDASFLKGWELPLPMPPATTIRQIRYGKDTGKDVLNYEHFSVVMSAERRLPIITAVNIDGKQAVRNVPRETAWYYDGRLDKSDQWGDALYDNNKLDRGHMVRRDDPVWGTKAVALLANKDTFHFTNSCPQMAAVNQQTWLGLEDYILHNAEAAGMQVSVFTGPVFTDKDLVYRDALVPLAFWKVVAIVTGDGRKSATAYMISQEKELKTLEFEYGAYQTYQVSVQQVGRETGIDFGELEPYDGFTDYERKYGKKMVVKLGDLREIRV
ncbi:DNA/RNA non-specific endonuclease [Chitinophaga silvisoli]|uniref:DNA/RNA non-specific endonuclease n=1 Tax=Chitinophaga silvisoli TaxID=2291814 RepID=A0A3E1NSV9_9BACT|nr:DNA/RNA non-specific endonuclease [Chitinophaga silvisoli]RFM30993.1 DNA/RNA non-specific endonuclease [Chitinophaga silvisoli]